METFLVGVSTITGVLLGGIQIALCYGRAEQRYRDVVYVGSLVCFLFAAILQWVIGSRGIFARFEGPETIANYAVAVGGFIVNLVGSIMCQIDTKETTECAGKRGGARGTRPF